MQPQNPVGCQLQTYNPKSKQNMRVMQPQNPACCQPAALEAGKIYM